MPAYKQIYDATDTTLQDFAIIVSQDGGTTYGATIFHAWNDKGGAHGDATTLVNARIRAMVDNGVSRVPSGFPIEDEAWTQMAIVGFNNAGDPNFVPTQTGFNPVGPNNPFLIPNIPKNCAIYISVKIVVPAGISANITQDLYLEIVDDEASVPLALNTGLLAGAGILPDWRDAGLRRLRRGRSLTAAGTATVTITKGAFVYDGVPYNVLQSTKLLNQTANDGVLAVGQSYIARLSQKSDKTVTVTKGNKGAAPAAPALPAGEIFLGDVTVIYQGGGTSIINSGDLNMAGVLYGEYLVYAGTGLTAKVGAGKAITSTDQQPFSGATSTVALADNANNRVWLNPDGTFTVNTSTTPPIVGALNLGLVLTAAGVISSPIVDTRPWSDIPHARSIILSYFGEAVVTTGLGAMTDGVPISANGLADYYLEFVDVRTRVPGGGGGVDMKIAVKSLSLGGVATTIYTSSGTDDQRPVVLAAFDFSRGNIDHEVNAFAGGTIFTFDIVAIAATTPHEDVFVILNIRLK